MPGLRTATTGFLAPDLSELTIEATFILSLAARAQFGSLRSS